MILNRLSMELISKIVKSLLPKFGNVYSGSLEVIDGMKVPVYYDGNDYKSLLPNDTQDEIIYLRELNSSRISPIDLGGCQKTLFVNNNYRIVFYSSFEYNTFAITQKFYSALASYQIEINSVVNNVDSLFMQESGKKKHIRLKNVGYFAIDFSVRKEINKCELLDDCKNEVL